MPSQRQIQIQTRSKTNASRSWIPTTALSCHDDNDMTPRNDRVRGRRDTSLPTPGRRNTAMGEMHREESGTSMGDSHRKELGSMPKKPSLTPKELSAMQKKTTPSILPPDTRPAVKARIYPGYIPFSVRRRSPGGMSAGSGPYRRSEVHTPITPSSNSGRSRRSDKDGGTPSRESSRRVRSRGNEVSTPSRESRESSQRVKSIRNETQYPGSPTTPSSNSQRVPSRRSPPVTPSSRRPYSIPSSRSPPGMPSTVTPTTPSSKPVKIRMPPPSTIATPTPSSKPLKIRMPSPSGIATPTITPPSSKPIKLRMPPASAIATPIPRTSPVSRATHGIAVWKAVVDVGGRTPVWTESSSSSLDMHSERIDEGKDESIDEGIDEGDTVYEPRPLGFFDVVQTTRDESEEEDVVNSLLTWLEHPDLGFPETPEARSGESDEVHRSGDSFFERLEGLRGEMCLPCD